jgi:hypothetical protein
MSSKKISDMSPPQLGIGRFSKAGATSAGLSIQSGSPFIHDISRTSRLVEAAAWA